VLVFTLSVAPIGKVIADTKQELYWDPDQESTTTADMGELDDFADELVTDPFLKSLVELRDYVNMIDPDSQVLVGKYLKATPWYTNEVNRLENDSEKISKLDEALSFLDIYSNYYPGQKVQCYAFAVLIEAMDSRFVEIGGIPIKYAADLVPPEIKSGYYDYMRVKTTGIFVMAVKTIDQVNVGDLGVLYATKAGHVFAVVAKKSVNGQTVLLIASSNQDRDGKIALTEVSEQNFDDVFGTLRKVVLRH
jgi:hypothetical protein